MRVVHVVIGKVNTHKMNGVNKVVHELASAQHSLGYQVTVWGITKNPTHTYPPRNYDTVLFQDRVKFRISNQIATQLRELPKDTVFHFHGGFIWQFNRVAKEILKCGFTYVLTPHGSYNKIAMQRSYFKKRLFIVLFENYLVSHAKAIHFIGESEISGAKTQFQIPDYALISNGEKVKESISPKKHRNSKTMHLGFCGRLDIHTKGLDLLLKGFAQFTHSSHAKSELWLIGDGPEKSKLEKLASALGVENYVKFCGAKFGNDKIKLFKKIDFLVLTSRNEGMPGVVLETAAIGIPSIVSHPTNMASFVSKYQSGVPVENNTPSGICKSLQLAVNSLDSGLYEKMSDGAIKMVESEFDWNNIAKKMIEIYAR